MPAHTTTTIDGKAITNEEFYEQARRWAAIVRNQAKRNASAFRKGKDKPHTYKEGGKAGKLERKLTSSIQFKIEHDQHIPECVSFKIPIHGIYREWAVGWGQPRVSGKWKNPRPRIRRTMADWLDIPIDRNAEKLFDLAAEFWGDNVLVNFFGTKK